MSQWKPKPAPKNDEKKISYKPSNTDRIQRTPNKVQMLRSTESVEQCCECGEYTNFTFLIRNVPLCESCYKILKWTKYKTLSRKQATEQFFITPESLHGIPSVKVPHPTRSDWTLRLFLKSDVETLQPQSPQPRENVTTITLFTFQPLSDDMKRTFEMQIRIVINNFFSDYLRVDKISYGDG